MTAKAKLLKIVAGESGVWLEQSFYSCGHVFCAYIPSQEGYNSLEVEASPPFLMEYQAPKNEAQIGPHRENPKKGEIENELQYDCSQLQHKNTVQFSPLKY